MNTKSEIMREERYKSFPYPNGTLSIPVKDDPTWNNALILFIWDSYCLWYRLWFNSHTVDTCNFCLLESDLWTDSLYFCLALIVWASFVSVHHIPTVFLPLYVHIPLLKFSPELTLSSCWIDCAYRFEIKHVLTLVCMNQFLDEIIILWTYF